VVVAVCANVVVADKASPAAATTASRPGRVLVFIKSPIFFQHLNFALVSAGVNGSGPLKTPANEMHKEGKMFKYIGIGDGNLSGRGLNDMEAKLKRTSV
jgi:hypothetical protein